MKQKTSAVNQITEGVIWKQLLLFFFPIMLGTLFQQLYNTADAIIVGRFVGKEAACLCRWLFRTANQSRCRILCRAFFRCNRHHCTLLWRKE